MKIRGTLWLLLMTVAGIVSAVVTLYGVYSFIVVDLRANTVLTGLYCLLPILCFPGFLLVKPARRSAIVVAILAVAYFAVYALLNRRSCSELGYCESVASTLLETLRTRSVTAFFGATILGFLGLAAEPPVTPPKK